MFLLKQGLSSTSAQDQHFWRNQYLLSKAKKNHRTHKPRTNQRLYGMFLSLSLSLHVSLSHSFSLPLSFSYEHLKGKRQMGLGTVSPFTLFLNCQYSQGDSLCDSLGDSFLPHPWDDSGLRRRSASCCRVSFNISTLCTAHWEAKLTEPHRDRTTLLARTQFRSLLIYTLSDTLSGNYFLFQSKRNLNSMWFFLGSLKVKCGNGFLSQLVLHRFIDMINYVDYINLS